MAVPLSGAQYERGHRPPYKGKAIPKNTLPDRNGMYLEKMTTPNFHLSFIRCVTCLSVLHLVYLVSWRCLSETVRPASCLSEEVLSSAVTADVMRVSIHERTD